MIKNAFLIHVKSSFRSWNKNIFVLTFWLYRKQLDKIAKINFKIYDVTDWIAINYNTHIVHYLQR